MGHHVVDGGHAEMDQAPVQPDGAIRAGAAPARLRIGQLQPLDLHAQAGCEVRTALLEHPARLALQPGLDGIADLRRLGRLGQAQVQGQPRHAGQSLGVGLQDGPGDPLVEHQDHGLAQEGQPHPIGPLDAGGFMPAGTLVLVDQLAADPRRLRAQGVLDLGHAHPARCPHAETFGTHHHADAAAARAGELIAHHRLTQADLAAGARMAKDDFRWARAGCTAAGR